MFIGGLAGPIPAGRGTPRHGLGACIKQAGSPASICLSYQNDNVRFYQNRNVRIR
jgi:hypothetical protein